jgi:4a-hydroxytetrahydrobiopterin dehydratase
MSQIPAWRIEDNELRRSFTFPDFIAAFGFMSRVALLAERMAHHPNWSNVYNRVDIGLNTHEVGGISDNDFRLAQEIERLIAN